MDSVKSLEVQDYHIIQNMKAAFYRLWKLKFVVFLSAAIGLLLAVMYLTITGVQVKYSSTATIYSAVYGSYSETVSGVSVMNTYAGVLGSSRVCDRAAALIDNPTVSSDYLKGMVSEGAIYLLGASTESKSYGYKLVLTVIMEEPELVEQITNAMAEAFASEINDLLGVDIIQVFDTAKGVKTSYSVSRTVVMLVATVAMAFLSAVIIFVKELFDSKVYIVSQCESDETMILGILPYTE